MRGASSKASFAGRRSRQNSRRTALPVYTLIQTGQKGGRTMTYLKNVLSRKIVPQSAPIPGSNQVRNSAGGYAYPVDDWVRLDRFLILGSEGGSYYASERRLTLQNAEAVLRCIDADGPRVVFRIVEI